MSEEFKRTGQSYEEMQAYNRKWFEDRPGYRAEHTTRFRAKGATPSWINQDKVAAIYKEAALQGMVVDHIVPLQTEAKHPTVCGLHWEGNLQIITHKANREKGHKKWPNMW